MILISNDFNGYIGIKVLGQLSGRPKSDKPGYEKIPLTVMWCPVKKAPGKNGRKMPDWKALKVVENFSPKFMWIPLQVIEEGSHDDLQEYFNYDVEYLIQEVMDHFCRIGECKINPHRCPEGKK